MPVESHHDGQGFVLSRITDGLADDLLMAEMNPIKHSNGQTDLAALYPKLFGRMDGGHSSPVNPLVAKTE